MQVIKFVGTCNCTSCTSNNKLKCVHYDHHLIDAYYAIINNFID